MAGPFDGVRRLRIRRSACWRALGRRGRALYLLAELTPPQLASASTPLFSSFPALPSHSFDWRSLPVPPLPPPPLLCSPLPFPPSTLLSHMRAEVHVEWLGKARGWIRACARTSLCACGCRERAKEEASSRSSA